MSATPLSSTRRSFLSSSTAAGAVSLLSGHLAPAAAAGDAPSSQLAKQEGSPLAKSEAKAIRPFRIDIPEEAVVDLRRRIAATRWPERENVNDFSQGVQLAKLQPLVRYWGTDYDCARAEAKFNALPQCTALQLQNRCVLWIMRAT